MVQQVAGALFILMDHNARMISSAEHHEDLSQYVWRRLNLLLTDVNIMLLTEWD
jgi:hypothetical protein